MTGNGRLPVDEIDITPLADAVDRARFWWRLAAVTLILCCLAWAASGEIVGQPVSQILKDPAKPSSALKIVAALGFVLICARILLVKALSRNNFVLGVLWCLLAIFALALTAVKLELRIERYADLISPLLIATGTAICLFALRANHKLTAPIDLAFKGSASLLKFNWNIARASDHSFYKSATRRSGWLLQMIFRFGFVVVLIFVVALLAIQLFEEKTWHGIPFTLLLGAVALTPFLIWFWHHKIHSLRWAIGGTLLTTLGLALLPFLLDGGIELFLALVASGVSTAIRATRPSVEAVTKRDARPPVVFLRSFEFDAHHVHGAFILENAIGDEFEHLGPLIAIGRPGERVPAGIAARAQFGSEWRETISEWLENARLIVLVAGQSEGVLWELSTISNTGKLPSLVLIIPPKGPEKPEPDRPTTLGRLTDWLNLSELRLWRLVVPEMEDPKKYRQISKGSQWRSMLAKVLDQVDLKADQLAVPESVRAVYFRANGSPVLISSLHTRQLDFELASIAAANGSLANTA